MNCPHKKTLTYQLTNADVSDFNMHLEEVHSASKTAATDSHQPNFLTPMIRGARAKSVLGCTTKTNTTEGRTSISKQILDIDADQGEYFSSGKRYSSMRCLKKSNFKVPSKLQNC